jgi:predicted transposase/invertase (TIGR01784 family)
MTRNIKTPHDHFFRSAMSRQAVAKAFFETHLPAHILKRVDLSTLILRNESHVDEELKEVILDLLFSVNIDQPLGYLHLLLEHRSTPSRWLPLKSLQYLVAALDNHRKETASNRLPVIVPIVFYHGKPTPYPGPKELLMLFDDPFNIMKDIVQSRFHLVDVGQIPDEKLQEQTWLNVLQFCMKHAFTRDVLSKIPQIIALWRGLLTEGAEDYILESYNYLINNMNVSDEKKMIKMIQEQLPTHVGDKMMTIAQQFEAKGRAEGKVEGKVEGRAEGKVEGSMETKKDIAQRLLEKGTSIEAIAQITDLPIKVVQVIADTLKESQH